VLLANVVLPSVSVASQNGSDNTLLICTSQGYEWGFEKETSLASNALELDSQQSILHCAFCLNPESDPLTTPELATVFALGTRKQTYPRLGTIVNTLAPPSPKAQSPPALL